MEPIMTSTVQAADDFVRHMAQIQDEVKVALKHAADEMKKYYDQKCSNAPIYQEGDKAWLNLQNYTTNCPTKKLDHKLTGPFVITKVISTSAVKLHLTA